MDVTTAEPARAEACGPKNPSGEPGYRYPVIIQGGMGAGVSNWRLANAVARAGQMGVVSGTALDLILTRRLQDGDPGGHMRRALRHFPVPEIAERVSTKYFIPGGKDPKKPYRPIPRFSIKPTQNLLELTLVANFAEVWLAKEGHEGRVGLNLLEKIQTPNIVSLYGAMLAGVDFVLMGAGVPREIPGVLDRLAHHEGVSLRIHVAGALKDEHFHTNFDPRKIIPQELPSLMRPKFLAIVSSVTLALTLMKKSAGKVDGFIIEGATAGGHNAPPRGQLQLQENGEPCYGPKDDVDLSRIEQMGLPFWVAGSCDDPETLKKMQALGAKGVQVGTLFAFCEESGLAKDLKEMVCQKAVEGEGEVFTDPFCSPTRFPFKVLQLEGSISEKEIYEARPRMCDLGYLQEIYRREDGTLGHRCAAEPVEDYLKKGGLREDTKGRKCLCNSLLANVGYPQIRKTGYREKPLVTSGNGVNKIARFLPNGKTAYTALDVIRYLLHGEKYPMTESPASEERANPVGEEIASAVSHGVGLLAAVAAAPILILAAVQRGGTSGILGASVFAAAMVLLYLASTLSHALPKNRSRRLFEDLDQMAIYILIAGTYTPFTLGVLRGTWGWTLFGLVWGLAAAGILLKATGRLRSVKISTGLYLAMGWLALIAVEQMWFRIPPWGLFWIFLGGMAYTAGVGFFAAKRIPYNHFIWHLFVIIGTTCHFIAVLWYAA